MSGATWPCPVCAHPLMSFERAEKHVDFRFTSGTVIGCAGCGEPLVVTGHNQARAMTAEEKRKRHPGELDELKHLVEEARDMRAHNVAEREIVIGRKARMHVEAAQSYRRLRAELPSWLHDRFDKMFEAELRALSPDEQAWATRVLSRPEA